MLLPQPTSPKRYRPFGTFEGMSGRAAVLPAFPKSLAKKPVEVPGSTSCSGGGTGGGS